MKRIDSLHAFSAVDLFEKSPLGVAYCRMIYESGKPFDFEYLYSNPALHRITGLGPVSGKRVSEVIPGVLQSDAPAIETFERVARTGQSERFETFVVGLQQWFSISVLCPQPGDFVAMFSLVTGRKEAEERLAASEARYRAVVEDQTEMISRFLPDRRFTFVNEVYCRVFGKSADELIGKTWEPVVYPEDLPALTAELGKLSSDNPVVTIENRVYVANGDLRWMQFVNRGFYDAFGRLTEVQSVGRDITALKQVQDQLQAQSKQLATALSRSDELLHMATEGAAIGLWYWPMPGGKIEWDDRCREMFSLPHDAEVTLEYFHTALHPDDRPQVERLWMQAVERRSDYLAEYRVVRPDGSIRWLSAPGRVFTNADGCVRGMGGVVIDITAQKQASADLERMRLLMTEGERIAGLGTWEYVAATKEVVWSEGEFAIYGVDPKQKSPDYPLMLRQHIHPDDAAELDRVFNEAMQHGKPYSLEHRIIRADGSIRTVRNLAYPEFDTGGNLVRYIGTTLDVTEQKQAVAELERSRFLMSEGEKLAVVGSFEFDVATRMTNWSEGQYRLHGIDPGQPPLDFDAVLRLVHPDDVEQATTAFLAALKVAMPFRIEHRIIRPDGEVRWVRTIGLSYADHTGKVTKCIGATLDITQERNAAARLDAQALELKTLNIRLADRADAAEAANRAKTAFLGTVSHELRTPLNAILGFSGLLWDGSLGETAEAQHRPIEIIHRSAMDLLDLVNDIIDISNIESGNLTIDTVPIVLRPLLDEVRQSLEPSAAARKLDLQPLVCTPDIVVKGESRRLAQVVRNLVGNAIKFTDQGSILVTATAADGWARVEVHDTGIGISRNDQSKLFQPFQRFPSKQGPLRPGTGLGLSICRRLVNAMGGEIGVESEPDRGSTFWFTIRLA